MNNTTLISLNPSNNYEIIGHVAITSHADIRTSVLKARNAQSSWASIGLTQRIKFLEQIYQKFKKHKKQLCHLIAQEVGIPISVGMNIDINVGLQYMRGYLDNAERWLAPEITYENDTEIHYLFFEPTGVAGLSIPWNYPFCNFIWGAIQHLIAGNTIVFKHSEDCPLTGKLIDKMVKSTDLPQGVFNQVYGTGSDTGAYLMNTDIDMIWFTGSTRVGKELYHVAAQKFIPALLELGGSAPGIVFEDADLTMAIESIYEYRFLNSGQTCDGLKRLIVHGSIFDEVVNKLSHILSTKKVGPANDPSTDIGPLAAERHLNTLEHQVSDALTKGARVICGAKSPSGLQGAYYEPTILTDITYDMRIWNEEVFGPVLPIVAFETEEKAVELANGTRYGLGGYIYTKNKQRALDISKKLQTGNVCINGASYVIAQDPFGGYKDSGIGREHGKAGLREVCLQKLVAFKK